MKIKDKLIHLLGGLTKNDWIVENKPPKYTQCQKNIVEINAKYCVRDAIHKPPDDYIKREMMAKLANTILEEKLVSFYTKPIYPGESDYPQNVCATIKVVEPMDEGEAYEMPI